MKNDEGRKGKKMKNRKKTDGLRMNPPKNSRVSSRFIDIPTHAITLYTPRTPFLPTLATAVPAAFLTPSPTLGVVLGQQREMAIRTRAIKRQ